jgi:hypothetical protein
MGAFCWPPDHAHLRRWRVGLYRAGGNSLSATLGPLPLICEPVSLGSDEGPAIREWHSSEGLGSGHRALQTITSGPSGVGDAAMESSLTPVGRGDGPCSADFVPTKWGAAGTGPFILQDP